MRGATAHTGVEPCVGPKTIVMSSPRVIVIGLLALAKFADLKRNTQRHIYNEGPTSHTSNTFRRGESACKLRQREKSYYYDAREAHYNRFGPHAWFDPSMRGRTSHHF